MTDRSTVDGPWDVRLEGQRVVIGGRFGVVRAGTSTHALVDFHDSTQSVARSATGDLEPVEWGDLLGATPSAVLMDKSSAKSWKAFENHNRRKTAARLAVVNLVATGCRSGQERIVGAGEPVESLKAAGRRLDELDGEITARVAEVHGLLTGFRYEWVEGVLLDLNAALDPQASPSVKVPSTRAMQRWIRNVREFGLMGLADGRGGDMLEGTDIGDRRKSTIALVDEVVGGLSSRNSSRRTDEWVRRRVEERAAEAGIALLGERSIRTYASKALTKRGRTPMQMKAAEHDAARTERQSQRASVPCEVLAFDATLGNNMVLMTPDSDPVRPWVQIAVDSCTGVVVSVSAAGTYRAANVAMLLYDAFRPMVILPDPDGFALPRIKSRPREIWLSEGALKPGGVPGRLRADNIAQNHADFVVAATGVFGCDISPSRPGVSTDNASAEAVQGAFGSFYEDLDAYVGRHAAERARDPSVGEYMSIDEYDAQLKQFAYFQYNHAPSAHPLFRRSGRSRLEVWDLLIRESGIPPMLVDPNQWFCFLPSQKAKRTKKGLQLLSNTYSSRALFELPTELFDKDEQVEVLHDPRQLDCVWVHDPHQGAFLEVPNVLRDITGAPLTRDIMKKARSMARVSPTEGHHAATAFAQAMDEIHRLPKAVNIARSLADWRQAHVGYLGTCSDGADVVNGPTAFPASGAYGAEPTSGVADSRSPRPGTGRGAEAARPGSARPGSARASRVAGTTEDLDLDMPIDLEDA